MICRALKSELAFSREAEVNAKLQRVVSSSMSTPRLWRSRWHIAISRKRRLVERLHSELMKSGAQRLAREHILLMLRSCSSR